MQHKKYLVIIEAPGKVSVLTRIFDAIGMQVNVVATRGHILSNPDTLSPLCIDRQLRETSRVPIDPAFIEQLRMTARRHDIVLIATDPDQEGDVIAWDVAEAIGLDMSMARLRLRGLDEESVREACIKLAPVSQKDAWPGTARRIADRLIGGTFTNIDTGATVGRIQSAILGIISREHLPFGQLNLVLPAADGGNPYTASIPMTIENAAECEELLEASKEAAPLQTTSTEELSGLGRPWNFGECVIAVSERLEIPIAQSSAIMQRLYESGRMSYPRAQTNALTENALDCLKKIARDNDIHRRFMDEEVPRMSARHAHESPRPMTHEIDIETPTRLMDKDSAALSIITRNLIASGMAGTMETALCREDWAQGLTFHRVRHAPVPWKINEVDGGIRHYPQDEAILRALVKRNLARPGTQVGHSIKFAERGLADEFLNLTPKGEEWLAQTPVQLLEERFIIETERLLAIPNLAPQACVSDILSMLGSRSGDVFASLNQENALDLAA